MRMKGPSNVPFYLPIKRGSSPQFRFSTNQPAAVLPLRSQRRKSWLVLLPQDARSGYGRIRRRLTKTTQMPS